MNPKSQRRCERCGILESETEMNLLAYNGARLVCDPCNSDLDREWVAEEPGRKHPLDTFSPPIATDRPGDMAAVVADETGMSYADALVFCNMD